MSRVDFGNEAGDDVDDDLASYFVEQEAFARFLLINKRLLVITARKGVGKSALLRWSSDRIATRDPSALVIYTRGADLVRNKFNLSSNLSTPNDHISDWMTRLCALVNRRLALELGFAATDDEISLIETAELEGYKSRNLIGCLVERLQTLLEKGRTTTKLRIANEAEVLKRVRGNGQRKVWVVIDDLDATFQNTPAELLSLSTFFSACRYLTQDLKGINFRVSMRTDVWPLIRRYDESLDKLDQYVSEILWTRADFLKLLSMRVKVNLDHFGFQGEDTSVILASPKSQEKLLDYVFVSQMRWGERMNETYKVIFTLAYERPRWAIQLCKLAQTAAVAKGLTLIAKESIDEVWAAYGYKRISDLVAEHKHQCPEVEELVNAFRGSDRQMSTEVLLKWITNHIVNHVETRIEGSTTRSAKEVARFMYRIGFIVARSDAADGSYEHYRFDQMPDLLSNRTNADFNLNWEIHPCYREALDIKKLDRAHRAKFRGIRELGS